MARLRSAKVVRAVGRQRQGEPAARVAVPSQAARWQRMVVPAVPVSTTGWRPAQRAPGRSRTGRSRAQVRQVTAAPAVPRPRRGRSARCRVDQRQRPSVPARSWPAAGSGSRPQSTTRRTRAWVAAPPRWRPVFGPELGAQGPVRSVRAELLASRREVGKPPYYCPAILIMSRSRYVSVMAPTAAIHTT
jgi:hypothetical protein